MEEPAHVTIHYMHACIPLVVLGSLTWIKNDAEGEKVAIRAEKQVKIDSSHIPPNVLIKDKVNKLETLEDEQGFHFWPAFNCPRIVYQASDHKLCHH